MLNTPTVWIIFFAVEGFHLLKNSNKLCRSCHARRTCFISFLKNNLDGTMHKKPSFPGVLQNRNSVENLVFSCIFCTWDFSCVLLRFLLVLRHVFHAFSFLGKLVVYAKFSSSFGTAKRQIVYTYVHAFWLVKQECFHSVMKHENDISDTIGFLQVVRIYSFIKEKNKVYIPRYEYIVFLFVKTENNFIRKCLPYLLWIRLHEPGLAANPGQFSNPGYEKVLFTWTRIVCDARHVWPTRVG
mgnify:CR=1 FL=1